MSNPSRKRWPHQTARREVLDGTWQDQLVDAAGALVGSDRLAGWVRPSTARNVALHTCRELAVLYDEPAQWTHSNAAAGEFVTRALAMAQAQQQLQRLQTYAVGIGSCYLRIKGHVAAEPGGLPRLELDVVPPDRVMDIAADGASRQPALVREYIPRVEGPRTVWTADEWDIRDPDAPAFRSYLLRNNGNLEELEGERRIGDAYPYRRGDGRPVLPYVLYHDGPPRVGLHDPHHRAELFAGSMDVAVRYWLSNHVFYNASFPLRNVLGMRLVGTTAVDDNGRPIEVSVGDPAVLGQWEPLPEYDGQPIQWQWLPGADVEMLMRVNDDAAGRLAVEAGGVSPTDLHRAAPNRSGHAIALTNEGKRRQQARFRASFQPGDERLAAVAAAVLRSMDADGAIALDLPDTGYRVVYGEIPLSAEERDARRRHAMEARAAGLMTHEEAYAYIHPELSIDEVRERLVDLTSTPNREEVGGE